MATLEELKAQLKAVERERFNLRRGLEVGDPAARARDNELRPQNIYLLEAVARAENAQNNTYTVRQIFADGWEIQDQTGRVVSRGRSPQDAVERARDNGARPEDLARIQLPSQAATQPQAPPGAWKIEIDANTGLWRVTYNGRPMGRAELVSNAILLARQRADQINDPVTGEGPGTIGALTPEIAAQLQSQADSIQQERQAALNASNTAAADQGPGTVSAGETTAQAQTARDDGATTQNPTAPVTVEGRVGNNISNADSTTSAPTSGTNDPTRSGNTTQAVPSPTAATPIARGGTPTNPQTATAQTTGQQNNTAPRSSGSSSREDTGSDADGVAANPVQVLAGRTARRIVPQDNVLDQYSSYTYSISIYIMSPEDYRRLMESRQKYIPGYLLLMQSGGAPTKSDVTVQSGVADVGEVPGQGPSLTQGRNQFFPLDYYIDDLELSHVMPGKGTGMPHNVTNFRFKIFEPNGISLLSNLYRAAQQYVTRGGGASTSTQNNNYAAQNYLMVIRFYGYDKDGNLLTQPTSTAGESRSDANAILEKFIPFQFENISFRIANRVTEYSCQAVCPQNAIATAQGRGTIPYNIQLTATSLQNLFSGNVKFTEQRDNNQDTRDTATTGGSSAPANATAAPQPTLAQGLTQALNTYQAELVKAGTFTVADVYEIRISHPEIADAKVVPPGGVDRSTKPQVQATSAAQAKDGDKQSVQNNAKIISATAGTSIVQFLDMAVRNSTYIIDQQRKITVRGTDGKEKQIRQENPNKSLAWYRIGVQATPIGDRIDPKRGDFAYKIIYEIAPYAINEMKSDYFPNGAFRGVQKRYPYWFTGENTQIISYEQDFNNLYYITVNSGQNLQDLPPIDIREIEKRMFSPNSAESNQGQRGNPFEPSANAADFLYSPSDLSRVKLGIIGDPAWIMQGEIWEGLRSFKKQTDTANGDQDTYFAPFLPDGTINFDAGEALFQVEFNQPADYDILTGVMQIQRAR